MRLLDLLLEPLHEKPTPGAEDAWDTEIKRRVAAHDSRGCAFINTSSGFSDSGKWRVEGSQLCADWQRSPSSCSEVQLNDETVYVKRVSNGEVIALVLQ